MGNKLGLTFLLLALLSLAACPARSGAVVKNASATPISLTVGDFTVTEISPGKTALVPFSITPDGDYKEREIVATWPGTDRQLSARAFDIWKEAVGNGAPRSRIHVIVSDDTIRAATDQDKGE